MNWNTNKGKGINMFAIERDDSRLKGVVPKGNVNFACVQHFIPHLAPNLVPLKLC